MNRTTERVGEEIKIDPYIFTKGGERSKEPTPAIYTVGYAGEGGLSPYQRQLRC